MCNRFMLLCDPDCIIDSASKTTIHTINRLLKTSQIILNILKPKLAYPKTTDLPVFIEVELFDTWQWPYLSERSFTNHIECGNNGLYVTNNSDVRYWFVQEKAK